MPKFGTLVLLGLFPSPHDTSLFRSLVSLSMIVPYLKAKASHRSTWKPIVLLKFESRTYSITSILFYVLLVSEITGQPRFKGLGEKALLSLKEWHGHTGRKELMVVILETATTAYYCTEISVFMVLLDITSICTAISSPLLNCNSLREGTAASSSLPAKSHTKVHGHFLTTIYMAASLENMHRHGKTTHSINNCWISTKPGGLSNCKG
jgi:hypothetical protein